MDKKKIIIGIGVLALLLFAGVSTVIAMGLTQIDESQDKTTDHEKALSKGDYLSSYTTGVRITIIRMVLAGAPIEKIRFNRPEEFSTLDDPKFGVFHPDGGGGII